MDEVKVFGLTLVILFPRGWCRLDTRHLLSWRAFTLSSCHGDNSATVHFRGYSVSATLALLHRLVLADQPARIASPREDAEPVAPLVVGVLLVAVS